jgi:hypothetical protein
LRFDFWGQDGKNRQEAQRCHGANIRAPARIAAFYSKTLRSHILSHLILFFVGRAFRPK